MIRAAGGVVWRAAENGHLEVAVVHRPRRDDWSLPKGKLAPGEHEILAARREVTEETGLQVAFGRRLPTQHYQLPTGNKRVDFWAMRTNGGSFAPSHEVDDLRWMPLDAAGRDLPYPSDRAVLAAFADTADATSTVLLVRHARAGNKKHWKHADELRPLDSTGRKQARALREILDCWDPDVILSADNVRCRQTIAPLADAYGIHIEDVHEFSETACAEDANPAIARLRGLAGDHSTSVVCAQRGSIPALVTGLAAAHGVAIQHGRRSRDRHAGRAGIDDIACAKGSVWALEFTGTALMSTQYYPRFRTEDKK